MKTFTFENVLYEVSKCGMDVRRRSGENLFWIPIAATTLDFQAAARAAR